MSSVSEKKLLDIAIQSEPISKARLQSLSGSDLK